MNFPTTDRWWSNFQKPPKERGRQMRTPSATQREDSGAAIQFGDITISKRQRTELESARVLRVGMREVRTSRARSTGTLVTLVDNRDGGFDEGGQPWITLCEEHGSYCEHETRRLAERFMSAPEEWCSACGGWW